MNVSTAKRIGIKKYQQEKCDRITADIPKGKRDAYKLIAAELNLSLSQLIQRSVESYASENFHVQTITTQPTEKISPTQRRLLDAVEKLPADAQKSLLKFIESLSKAENIDKRADIP